MKARFTQILLGAHMKTKTALPPRTCSLAKSLFWTVLFMAAGQSMADTIYVSYVSGSPGGGIRAFMPSGASSLFATTYATSPMGLAFDGAGNLYAAVLNDTILKYTPGGVPAVFASTGLNNPHALAFDAVGNLYVANYDDSTLLRFTPDGRSSIFAHSGVNSPQGLAFDSKGNLYVANEASRSIEVFSATGTDLGVFVSTTAPWPHGLAFDGQGNLYVAEASLSPHDGMIERFTPDGARSIFASTGLADPFGIAFDSAGNLYVASLDSNTLLRFTPDGTGSAFATDLNNPTYIAVIPEPPTLGLLALCSLAWCRNRARELTRTSMLHPAEPDGCRQRRGDDRLPQQAPGSRRA